MAGTLDAVYVPQTKLRALDDLLFQVCDELQLSPTKHGLAESRYKTIGELLCQPGSPFHTLQPDIYPQGSMRLQTTVMPTSGPFDLDFVCQLSLDPQRTSAVLVLDALFNFLKSHGTYKDMVERKNRCVRIVYKDDFYMDILPACRDTAACVTCIQVPDRELADWTFSNPKGYALWFEHQSQQRRYTFDAALMTKAQDPLPALQSTEEKEILQLTVQLLKRWRDLYYCDSSYPPISIVLTTLAADIYTGESSIAMALLKILDGIVARLDEAHFHRRRLRVPNPTHPGEDFSERWTNRDTAYAEFNQGIRRFAAEWRRICVQSSDVQRDLRDMFGEVVGTVVEKQARHTQQLRERGVLGISSVGTVVNVSNAISKMRPNTNFGNG